MPTVFVISADWSVRATVRAELLHAGFHAVGMDSAADLPDALRAGRTPSAVVLDAALVDESPTLRAALENLARRVPMVVVDSRVQPGTPLEHAAITLYRPVRVGEVVGQVQKLLAGQAA